MQPPEPGNGQNPVNPYFQKEAPVAYYFVSEYCQLRYENPGIFYAAR